MNKNKSIPYIFLVGMLALVGLIQKLGLSYDTAFTTVFSLFILGGIVFIDIRIQKLWGKDSAWRIFFIGAGIIYFIGIIANIYIQYIIAKMQ